MKEQYINIKKIEKLGKRKCVDITVNSNSHLFLANNIVTSNSHAVCYTMFSAYELFFKANYPLEFYCVILNQVDRADEDKKGEGLLQKRIKHIVSRAIRVLPIDINKSKEEWSIDGMSLRASLSIKGMGKESETIVKNQPYSSMKDFLEKCKIGKGRVESLIFSGAFDNFDTRENLYNWYHNEWLGENKKEDNFDFFDDESEQPENYRKFTEQELKELELDINGYIIPKNIMVEYGNYIGTKLYNLVVKDILTVKKDNSHYPLVLGAIENIRISKSRTGKEWAYISLTDGFNELTVMLSKAKYLTRQKSLKKGNVVILPVAFSFEDDGTPKDRNVCFLSDEKNEIKVIKST